MTPSTPSAHDLRSLRGRAVISVEECGRVLGRSRSAAYEDARRGDIPTFKLGGRVFVPVPALLVWLGLPAEMIADLLLPRAEGERGVDGPAAPALELGGGPA